MEKDIKIISEKVIHDGWGTLQTVVFDQAGKNGKTQQHTQEMYDVGDGAAILLYNKEQKTVILNRQFRLVTVYNKNPSGMLIEVCAGKVEDGLSPEETVKKEAVEETGYAVDNVKHIMSLYMSPGSFTELLHFFIGTYDPANKPGEGGGKEEEGEDIEINEVPFDKAYELLQNREIKDAKTALLLQYARLNNLFD